MFQAETKPNGMVTLSCIVLFKVLNCSCGRDFSVMVDIEVNVVGESLKTLTLWLKLQSFLKILCVKS